MSKIGGSGTAQTVKNDFPSQPSFDWRVILPLASIGFVLALHLLLPAHANYRLKPLPYLSNFLTLLLIIYAVAAIASLFSRRIRENLGFKAAFHACGFLALGVYNLITIKFELIPNIYFPAPERIIGVFVEDWFFLLRCLVYSLRLLLSGFALGALVGVFTGTLIGWSRRFNYWIMPFIRVIGPIPSTAWIPVALVIFFKPTSASVFLIALGVWFPTTVLTSSGIMNVGKSYFEVSSTLGASDLRMILTVALPAAAPSIFTGLFNGTSACFLTLMAAEMIGCKFGIGWYINWQRETLAYANVYAGLIIIALTFSFLIGLQFKIRNKALAWQKGMIRW
ncbi:MAG: ABC transporter permease subunit [Spirochaetaceae bacterium]|jgi:NitT/TauT family transport system permease protein|nr:ABC transporter permease subunit [Spirochaetaceae bacterium]